jgi:MSHA biogenesis protein MshJ
MRAYWLKLSGRLDAMTLRERIAVFIATGAALLYLANIIALEPALARQKALTAQIRQQEMQLETIDMDIAARMAAHQANPDLATMRQLADANRQAAGMTGSLRTMQRGLVAPEKMSELLQQLLRANGKLKLVSLRTLPVTGLGATEGAALGNAAGAKDAPKPRELLYRHGVEVVLQGSYLDMLDYMEALEELPSQLFWGRVQLDARAYPNSTLTLTLYTLGLDDKWMTL